MFGALAPCPIRLTAESATAGWSASQHARVCADTAAAWRTAPLAILTVEVDDTSVSLVAYDGRNGSGAAHAPALTWTSDTQPCLVVWDYSYDNDFEEPQPWTVRHAEVHMHWDGSNRGAVLRQVPALINGADVLVDAGATVPYQMTIVVYGDWGEDREIGTYGGDLDKQDNTTEASIPYAAQWLRSIQGARGSAYTTKPATLVDCENLAIARMMGAVFSRTPEKFSANATPGRSDERLEYWVNVLRIPRKPSEPRWQLRRRAAIHYKAALGPTLDVVETACRELLGDAFVAVHTFEGVDLDNPPTPTYWPGGTAGPAEFALAGNGMWSSRRSHLWIEVVRPASLSLSAFIQLMDVQLFQLLDRMLPAWVDWHWAVDSGGFLIGISLIGIDRI